MLDHLVTTDAHFSLTRDGIPFPPRTCFNWLPQYRYGLMAHKALQRTCHAQLSSINGRWRFDPDGPSSNPPVPLNRVRPVLMDSVLRSPDQTGYVIGQCESVLQEFDTGRPFAPLSADLALIVAQDEGSGPLLNNILSYMNPAPLSLEALFALAGGYGRVTDDEIQYAAANRRAATGEFRRLLAGMYGLADIGCVLVHAAGVGGLIEAATRYMHFRTPKFGTCLYTPEYWDLLRCVLTYSPRNIRVVEGRDDPDHRPDAWLAALAQPGVDFAYTSVTSNPLGSTLTPTTLRAAIESVSDDTLFFLDFTSVDVHETYDTRALAALLAEYPRKNLVLTKSFAKDYNRGHLRVGYALFTRAATAQEMWSYMTAYPGVEVTREVTACLSSGNTKILEEYRRLNTLLSDEAAAYPEVRLTGTASNYTSVYFRDEMAASRMREAMEMEYGLKVFPGELPMQGGGALGLTEGEINLPAMKRIPFLPTNALRLLVTNRAIDEFFSLLGRVGLTRKSS